LTEFFRFKSGFLPDLKAKRRLEFAAQTPQRKGTARILSPSMATTKKRRIELIFFEQERIVRRSVTAHCPICRIESEMLTPQEAGDVAQLTLEKVDEWLAEGRAHSVRTSSGTQRICRNSLGPVG